MDELLSSIFNLRSSILSLSSSVNLRSSFERLLAHFYRVTEAREPNGVPVVLRKLSGETRSHRGRGQSSG